MADANPVTPTVVPQSPKAPIWLILAISLAFLTAAGSGAVSYLVWKHLTATSSKVENLAADLSGVRPEMTDLTQKLATAQAVHEQFRKQVEDKFAAQAAAPPTASTYSPPAATSAPSTSAYAPATPYVPSYTAPYTGSSGSSKKHSKGATGSSKKKSSKTK